MVWARDCEFLMMFYCIWGYGGSLLLMMRFIYSTVNFPSWFSTYSGLPVKFIHAVYKGLGYETPIPTVMQRA